MLNKPRFTVVERWDQSGTVDLYFSDHMTDDLHTRVSNEIEDKMYDLDNSERTTYHLENIVNNIFSDMIYKGNLVINSRKRWAWAEKI